MRFSDAFLRQVRDRVSIADYASRKLTYDKRKSRPAAGDFWACCPFHQEKSSSFHLLDQKGLFKCFGCGEKGDVFTLAMKLEGVSFPEAVAAMAERAGVPMPVDEHEDRGENERRKKLYKATERAAQLYAEALKSAAGAEARKYLQGRGLTPDLWPRFGIGYAPGGWTWLIDKLKAEKFTLDEIVEAGLAREGENGQRAIDCFRERVTFEIADPGGKVIAFGGRTLEKDNKAKYINSPDSPLFHKGRTLYRLKQARELSAKTKAEGLVVAEGYLDVIAFERAGIAAVAPLGTALTEDQLQLVWRAGGEPILCFDGDPAGQRAAERALDLALPHFGPGKTVRIAMLSGGQDPDDLFRAQGPEALKPLIDAAQPASDALFARELARRALTTPEARADFKERLRQAAFKVADPETKKLYLSDLMSRADAAMRPVKPPFVPRSPQPPGPYQGRQKGKPGQKFAFQPPITPELKAHAAAAARRSTTEDFLRAAIDFPSLLIRYEDWIDRLQLEDQELEAIRSALQSLMGASEHNEPIDREALTRHLTQSGEHRAAARLSGWPKPRAAEGNPDAGDLEAEWLALVTREVVLPAIKEEMAELRPLADEGDEAAFARFQALSREVRAIEARAREVKLDETFDDVAEAS